MYMLHCLVCCSDTYHHVGVSRLTTFNCAFKYIMYIPPTNMFKIFIGISAWFLANELKTHSSYCLECSLNISSLHNLCSIFAFSSWHHTFPLACKRSITTVVWLCVLQRYNLELHSWPTFWSTQTYVRTAAFYVISERLRIEKTHARRGRSGSSVLLTHTFDCHSRINYLIIQSNSHIV